MQMTFETAFAAYEAVRHRLPQASARSDGFGMVRTLDDIAAQFDVFLLDAFGVLNIGETAIPGVADRIEGLRRQGKRVMVVSNASGYPHAALMEKYGRLGFDFSPEEVVTSRLTMLSALSGREPRRWGLMATRATGLRDLETLDLVYLEEDERAYSEVEGFLLVGSAMWTETRQALLETALRDRPRPVLVGNPDIVAPRERGFSIEPGHYAHRLADATGITPEFFGKPFANIFDLALARLGPRPAKDRVIMVGDSLHTDILGAQTAGIASALVAGYGFFAERDANAAIAQAGIVPDFVLERP